jgi:acyl-coenzyme A thioesterase PaaI-like protein
MDKRNQARLNPACVVCGVQNPKGLRIEFVNESDGVRANWTPAAGWESFPGIVHGGIITTVLDEAMSKAIISRDWQALTAELRVRFHGRVSPGDSLQIRGWITNRRKRRILAEAMLTTDRGQELDHAWATFLTTPGPGAN